MAHSTIHTTLNMQHSMAAVLDEYAAKIGIKRSGLVALLLRRFISNWKKMMRTMTSVEYQKNFSGDNWKKVHVFFEPVDYEVFTDMRNCFKWSVSALLAMAIRKYLINVQDPEKQDFFDQSDNYQIHGYHCEGKLYNNNICWHIIWELDEKFTQKLAR